MFVFVCYFTVLGNGILGQMQRKNERRIQQTYQQLVEAERTRMENEYRQKSDEMIRKWKAQSDEEKRKLQKVIFFLVFEGKHSICCISLIGI